MHVVYIRNYKRKALLFSVILASWALLLLLSNTLLNKSLIFNITINNFITFSYPFSMEVDNIYVNEQVSSGTIQTDSGSRKPITEKFTSYNSLKGKFSFSYPSMFLLNQEDFAGSDILYHIDFHDRTKTNRGFVQVWNLPYPLKDFLAKSKSTSHQNYKYFNASEITVNSLPGFYWDYVVAGNDGASYKGSEAFFQKADRMYRLSYFVPENLWNKDQAEIFRHMVNSFKTF